MKNVYLFPFKDSCITNDFLCSFIRDVKARSILLDDNFEVRFGSLSHFGPEESDTHTFDDWIFRIYIVFTLLTKIFDVLQ